MTSRQRLLTALDGKQPDRLPVTTHHVMPYFLNSIMDGMSLDDFFPYFSLDAISWTVPLKADASRGEYPDPSQNGDEIIGLNRIFSDRWRISREELPDPQFTTRRHTIHTPDGDLTAVTQANQYTEWVAEPLLKEKPDIEIIAKHSVRPLCDGAKVRAELERIGERGIVRGFIPPFDVYGQPGCWQDACCIAGTERMILETFDDPGWVRGFLDILLERKLHYCRSLAESGYDIVELGGGDASSTVISPQIFNEFVAPYDARIIEEIHKAKVRVAYHTCGGMMPILEDIAAMAPDAMETFTPPGMGGDTDLAQAKERIGDKVCMIGGFDQGRYFSGCTAQETRQAVRDCFEQAGRGGGLILAPSDHFFDAEPELLAAFAEEAACCLY